MSLIDFSEQPRVNPLEVVERVASTNDWSFERAGDDEITILVTRQMDATTRSPSPGWTTSRRCISPAPSTSRCRSAAAPRCSS